MSKKLQKSLQDYLSKIKKPSPKFQFPSNSFSSSKKWILKGCKHPKTLSFAVHRNHDQGIACSNEDSAATLSDVDRFLFENFKSLFITDDDEEISERRANTVETEDIEGDDDDHVQISFASLSPKRSSSGATNYTTSLSMSEDMGSTSRSSASSSTNNTAATGTGGGGVVDHVNKSPSIPNECIALLTYSPNAYDDFRRSMQGMVEARLKHLSKIDWDFMEELLFCYLNLNDKKTHKFILSAFTDLVVDLRQNDMKIPVRSQSSKVSSVRDKRSRRTRRNVI